MEKLFSLLVQAEALDEQLQSLSHMLEPVDLF
jgi:hypothetical protein